MLFFSLFKWNKQTSDNHLSSVGTKWIQKEGHCSVSIETQDTSPPLMFLSLLVWMTDFLDQSVPHVFNNKRQNSPRTWPELISSLCQLTATSRVAQNYVLLRVLMLHTPWASIQAVTVSYHQTISLPLLPILLLPLPQPMNCSLFLINLLHTARSPTCNLLHHWIKHRQRIKTKLISIFCILYTGAAHWGICIPGNIFLIEVDVIAGGFIWWQAIPNATANTKETGLIVRSACLLLIKTNWHNIYLQAAPKLCTINLHFLVA